MLRCLHSNHNFFLFSIKDTIVVEELKLKVSQGDLDPEPTPSDDLKPIETANEEPKPPSVAPETANKEPKLKVTQRKKSIKESKKGIHACSHKNLLSFLQTFAVKSFVSISDY